MYFRVQAKCGHVGRNNYIEKTFYVKASTGKEAAQIVRYLPRVKHDRKDAIISVKRITKNEFNEGVKISRQDNYFKVTNSSDQRLLSAVDSSDIRLEVRHPKFRRTRDVGYKLRKIKILEKQYDKMLMESIYG